MNKAEQQYQISREAQRDTVQANAWLKQQGINAKTFVDLDVKLVQAQSTAHLMLTDQHYLLTQSQIMTIKKFQQKISNRRIRSKLKPEAAYKVLNISNKINRQIFKQNR